MMIAVALLAMAVSLLGPLSSDDSVIREERSYAGTGSRGVDTDIEVYLIEGTYGHRLSAECDAAASLFPGRREPKVPLRDVLRADLETSGPSIDTGPFTISEPGWANLQVGTGPECAWEYSITGMFLPAGSEPPPPRSPDEVGGPWVLGVLVIVGLITVVGVVRSRRSPVVPARDEESKVRVTPPAD